MTIKEKAKAKLKEDLEKRKIELVTSSLKRIEEAKQQIVELEKDIEEIEKAKNFNELPQIGILPRDFKNFCCRN